MRPAFAIAAVLILLPALAMCKDDNMKAPIEVVKRQNEGRLMSLPGVVSVGIGRDPQGRPAIVVGLSEPSAAAQGQVPRQLSGYPVVVQTIGPLKAHPGGGEKP